MEYAGASMGAGAGRLVDAASRSALWLDIGIGEQIIGKTLLLLVVVCRDDVQPSYDRRRNETPADEVESVGI
jgi:hypothetical protein